MGENMNKKILVPIMSVFLVIAFASGYITAGLQNYGGHKDPSYNVYFEVTKGEATGASATLASGNLITDIGEAYARDAAVTQDANTTSWAISLSNDGSPAAAWTQLTTEVAANGFTRAVGDSVAWTNAGDSAFNVTHTFTATGTQQLQTAGLQWDSTPSSNNNLFAAADFTQTTFNTDDTLTVTWVITFNAN